MPQAARASLKVRASTCEAPQLVIQNKARAAVRGASSLVRQRSTVRGVTSRAWAMACALGAPMLSSIIDRGGIARGRSCNMAGSSASDSDGCNHERGGQEAQEAAERACDSTHE